MNRLQFLRRITMATGALMIPKEAIAWTQQPEVFAGVEESLPGISGQVFKIQLSRGIFVPNDIIQVMGTRRQYFLRKKEGSDNLIGEDILDPTAPTIEIEWVDKITNEARKICSALDTSEI